MKNLTNTIQALLFILLSVNILSSQSSLVEPTITASVDVADFDNGLSTSVINRRAKFISKMKSVVTSEIYYDISDVDLSTTIDVYLIKWIFRVGIITSTQKCN